jgi:hypothetical protein
MWKVKSKRQETKGFNSINDHRSISDRQERFVGVTQSEGVGNFISPFFVR